jgi:hypothetical protein
MRNLDPNMAAALSSGLIRPVFLADLTFRSATRHVWTGVGNIVFNGNTYEGIGSFGSLGAINEGVEVKADTTTISLSGIDPVLLGESLTDIQQGAPAVVYFGLMSNTGTFLGSPYKSFAGMVDVPSESIGGDTITISLSLENSFVDGQRASNQRYTSADQRIKFPDDTGFQFVESLNDIDVRWGS